MPMTMKGPAHPGEIVREEVLRPLALSVTDAARALGVTRQSLSALLNERAALSPEMALRLEAAFGIKADLMMRVQLSHSMAEVRARQARSRPVSGGSNRAFPDRPPIQPAQKSSGGGQLRTKS